MRELKYRLTDNQFVDCLTNSNINVIFLKSNMSTDTIKNIFNKYCVITESDSIQFDIEGVLIINQKVDEPADFYPTGVASDELRRITGDFFDEYFNSKLWNKS